MFDQLLNYEEFEQHEWKSILRRSNKKKYKL